MAIYLYKAKKGPQETVNGEIAADTPEKAVDILNEKGLVVVKLIAKELPGDTAIGIKDDIAQSANREAGAKSKTYKERLLSFSFSGRVGAKDIYTFTMQLSSLVRANVPMLRSLSLIGQQTERRSLREIVNELHKQVKEGKMLSDAMGQYPKSFNNLYISMIKSGEKGGVLAEVLTRLAQYQEKELEIKYQIQAAMAYPILMIVVGAATVFVMLTMFMPKLIGLFENMQQALPLPTQVLIGVSKVTSKYWHVLFIIIGFAFAVFGRVQPGSKKKFAFDMVKLHLPFVKKLIKNAQVAKFSRTFGVLFKNGLPVHESLSLATNTLDNDALRMPLQRAAGNIINDGCTLSDSLKRLDIFPPFVINMIAVGEEGGQLNEALTEIANIYEKEVEQMIKIMTSLLEPLLILTVGSIVGFIVFAMLLPIFNMEGVMK